MATILKKLLKAGNLSALSMTNEFVCKDRIDADFPHLCKFSLVLAFFLKLLFVVGRVLLGFFICSGT